MQDGQILKHFIEGEPISKTRIAKDLGMTRQNLYNLYESVNLTDETKEKFEKYFKKKIFTELRLENGEIPIAPAKGKEPLETALENLSASKLIDSKNIERLISLLELKFGVQPQLPTEGTPGTYNIKEGINKRKELK